MTEDYRLGLARAYRQSKEVLAVDRAAVRESAAKLHAKWYADQEPDPENDVPTVDQLAQALWEWLHKAVDSLVEDADWFVNDRVGGVCRSEFDEALTRAMEGKPYHLDVFLDAQAARCEAEAAAAKAVPA